MQDSINVEIGKRIHDIRTDKELSRNELARRAGITPQFLRKVEDGDKGLSSKTIRSISIALSVTTDYLLFGHNDTKEKLLHVSQAFASFSDSEIKGIEGVLEKLTAAMRYTDTE